MAVAALIDLSARNPFRVYGTALAPGALLAAKLVALAFLVQGLWRLTDPFAPYLSLFNHVGDPVRFQHFLQTLWLAAAGALFLNIFPRVACAILGLTIATALLSSDAYRTNNLTYTAILFILIALSTRTTAVTYLRWQLVVLYGFAASNKLLDRGWRDGSFFDSWNTVQGYGRLYRTAADLFPGKSFSAGLSWGIIATEFLLMLAFAIPRFVRIGALAVIAYHSSLLFITGSTFTMFWYALVATAIAILWMPETEPLLRLKLEAASSRLLRAVDLGHAFVFAPGTLSLESNGVSVHGRTAVVYVFALQPAFYGLVYFFLAAPQDPDRRWAAVVAFASVAAALVLGRRPSVLRPSPLVTPSA